MNDRFKFRIFSKTAKKFIYFNDSELCIDRENMGLLFRSEHLYLGNYEELQQCTGLKDKNGKLIYEGDIVKSFHVSSTIQGRVFTGFVAYDDERCRYCIFENKHCSYATFSDTDDVFEVIGNIYENKDLLNENS